MGWRETWGLRLFLAGVALGLGLMMFVVTFDSSSFYQTNVASATTSGTTPLLGYVLDGGILLSFALVVGGMACFPSHPAQPEVRVPTPAPRVARRADREPRRDSRRRFRPTKPSVPQGST